MGVMIPNKVARFFMAHGVRNKLLPQGPRRNS